MKGDCVEVICVRTSTSTRDQFGVEPICETLRAAGVPIAPSTYCAGIHRPPSARQVRDEVVKEEINTVDAAKYDAFGVRKIHSVLNREPDYHGWGTSPGARSRGSTKM